MKKDIETLKQQLADKEVKIEVLERDIDNLYRTLEEANKEFAEKNKEIERLNGCMISEQQVRNVIENDIQTLKHQLNVLIRHQVCEEIRQALDEYINTYRWRWETPDGKPKIVHIPNFTIRAILREIEKGESDGQ